MSDGAGALDSTQAFYPFGELRTSSSLFDTERGFTGQIADAATGLNFYNARYQDPVLGAAFLLALPITLRQRRR